MIELVFSNCSYSVKPRSAFGAKVEKKMILNDISASVTSGRVLAIMGPSGAGKTTLLNLLTCEQGDGTAVGSVTLNGNPLDAKLYEASLPPHDHSAQPPLARHVLRT